MRLLARAVNASIDGLGGVLGRVLRRGVASGWLYFPFVSEALSLVPFSLGWKLRRAVYARLLSSMGRDAVLHFGVSIEDPRTCIGENVWVSVRCYLDYVEIGDAVLIGPHAVLLSGGRAHRFDQLQLAGGIVEMIGAADHMRHAHVEIIDHDREHIGRVAVAP